MDIENTVEAADLISEFVFDRWPDVVPINAVLIFEGLGNNNQRGLYALTNSDIMPWTLDGMLSLIRSDNRIAWEEQNWITATPDSDVPDDDE